MPHQCVRCGKVHEDGSRAILDGCSCGSKFFFYIRKDAPVEQQQKAAEVREQLSPSDLKKMENDVREIMNEPTPQPSTTGDDASFSTKPVVLDVETIRLLGPGKYELDVVNLFKDSRVVIKVGEGKYRIDLASVFKMGASTPDFEDDIRNAKKRAKTKKK